MPIDPYIASGIKLPQFNLPDYGADMAQMAQIQNARNQNALAQYQLGAAQRAEEESLGIKNYLTENAGKTPAELQSGLFKFGASGLAIAKALSEQQTAELTRNKTKQDIYKAKRDFADQSFRNISLNPSDENIRAWAQDAVIQDFMTKEEADAKANSLIAMSIPERQAYMASQGANSKELIALFESKPVKQTDGQQEWFVETNKRLPKFGERITEKVQLKATPGQQLSAEVAIRGQDIGAETAAATTAKPVVVGGRLVDPATGKEIYVTPEKPVVVGSALVDPASGKEIYQGRAAPTELEKLQAARDALPPGDPRRNELDKKILKETSSAKHYVSSDSGVFAVDPETNEATPVLINGKQLIDGATTRGKQYLDIARQRLNISRATEQRLSEEANSSGGLTPQALDIAAQMVMQSGVMPPLGSGKKASEARVQVMNRIAELQNNPDAAAGASSLITGKQDTVAATQSLKDFTSGVSSRRVTANNTAINHLETMSELADKLNNKDIRIVNLAGNAFSTATGQPAPTNFDAAKQLVAAEVIKAVVANGGGVKEREEAAQNFARANSPAQLKGVISTYKELLGGQLQSLENQYKAGTKRNDFRDRFLTPNTQKVLPPASSSTAASLNIPQEAINFLKQGKGTPEQFDELFGAGAAKKVLGKQ